MTKAYHISYKTQSGSGETNTESGYLSTLFFTVEKKAQQQLSKMFH